MQLGRNAPDTDNNYANARLSNSGGQDVSRLILTYKEISFELLCASCSIVKYRIFSSMNRATVGCYKM